MPNKWIFLLVLSLSAFAFPLCAVAQNLGPAAQWIPPDALVVVDIPQPKAVLARMLDEKATGAIAALPAYQKQAATPGFKQFLQLIKYLELQSSTDWKTGLTKLAGGGLTWAFCPPNRSVLIVDSEDERLLGQIHEILWKASQSKPVPEGQASPVTSQQIGNVTAWTLGPTEAHAIIGKRLIAAGGLDGIKAALELRSKQAPGGLAATATYQAAKRTLGRDAVGMIYFNLDRLKQAEALSKALKPDKPNPIAALLFAGIAETINQSKWMALGLHLKDDGVSLHLVADGKTTDPKSAAAFALSGDAKEGVLPNFQVPRQIAALSLYRDLFRFYQAKDQLFPERTSELIFFENMMGIFFSGRELTDDVMAQAKPEIRLVAANQEYDPAIGMPDTKIPAFAAVLQLRDPDNFKEVVEEAWQKAVGLSSFTRGQQALPGLIIDRAESGGIRYTFSRFSSLGIKDRTKIDSRFNFRPSLAMPGNYLILSSTDALARDLIEATQREMKSPGKPMSRVHSLMEISGKKVAEALQTNRETLVRQNMLKEGATLEAEQASIDGMISLAGAIESLRLNIGTQDEMNQAWLDIKVPWLSAPKSAAGK